MKSYQRLILPPELFERAAVDVALALYRQQLVSCASTDSRSNKVKLIVTPIK